MGAGVMMNEASTNPARVSSEKVGDYREGSNVQRLPAVVTSMRMSGRHIKPFTNNQASNRTKRKWAYQVYVDWLSEERSGVCAS